MRLLILGATGSGKTTLAKNLSERFGFSHIELDGLNWEPGWIRADVEVFRDRVAKAVEQDHWIVDGNYTSTAVDLIWPQAEYAIWLDFPLRSTWRRLLKRTFWNSLKKKELWPGCREGFLMQLFSRKSIFFWAMRSRKKQREKFLQLFERYPRLKWVRIRSIEDLELAFKDNGWFQSINSSNAYISSNKTDQ